MEKWMQSHLAACFITCSVRLASRLVRVILVVSKTLGDNDNGYIFHLFLVNWL